MRPISKGSLTLKPFSEIPKKRGLLPPFVELLFSGGPGYLHEYLDKRHRQLGSIFRERLGPNELVFVADANLIRTTIANEGPRPRPNVPLPWLYYNQIKSIDRGLLFQVGEPWYKFRRAFNKVLLANENTTKFSQDLLKINSDLFDYWRRNWANKCDNTIEIQDVRSDLCKWSIESTGLMLLGDRFGCVPSNEEQELDRRGEELVRNVSLMFRETSKLQLLPVELLKLAHKFNSGSWKRFENASDQMLQIANKYADDYIGQAKQANSKSSMVKDLLELNELSDEEISRSVIDLIVASADTTSVSLQWLVYLMAKYPEAQDALFQEARQLTASYKPTDLNNLHSNIPYHMAFIKEATRLYPTAPFIARTMDNDIVLDGFHVPQGTSIVMSLYTTSRMEQYYDYPNEFRPNRWLTRQKGDGHESCTKRHEAAYASLPFGVGSRKCIGHKVATLEMCLFVASFVTKFKVSLLDPSREVNIKLNLTLCPDRPIGLKLRPRGRSR